MQSPSRKIPLYSLGGAQLNQVKVVGALDKDLESLINRSSTNLNEEQSRRLRRLVERHQSTFATQGDGCGRTSLVQHRIDTGNSVPIKLPPRRVPLAQEQEIEELLEEMKKSGIIEPSSSPWSSPVTLSPKKDGSKRFCVDYRRLNNVTRKDSYPLPRIDDTFDLLHGSRWFATLDLKSGYWQVELYPADKEKTAFTTGSGLWQFTVMPFGLCNAPATFERLMENVLRGLLRKICLVYLDDVIVFANSPEELLDRLGQVLQRFHTAGLKLAPKKCQLFQKEVRYLGHIVSEKGIAADPEKLEAVKNWPVPQDQHEVRSFLGLCSYYRRFVKDYAHITTSLNQLMGTHSPFIWTDECQEAFDCLKEKLCSPPILALPEPGKTFIVDTDASNTAIGGVLSQKDEQGERVIAYFSKTLSQPEKNYCVTRRELLAVVRTLKHFHKYLYGQKFLLRTDHSALQWLMTFKEPEGQVARWIQQLQEYNFEVQHRKGASHRNADALSRRPCTGRCRTENHAKIQNMRFTTSFDLKEAQDQDEVLRQVKSWKQAGERPSWHEIADRDQELKILWAQFDSLDTVDGILCRMWESADGTEKKPQLLVPRSVVTEILQEVHNGISGGHLGVTKTLSKIRERFYWPAYKLDVENWCRRCVTCAASKGPQTRGRAQMRIYNVGFPFERIAMDVAGPFPVTKNGNRFVLVIGDYFSKWMEAYPIPNQEAETVAKVLVEEWIARFGVPLELHTDQGRNFESRLFQEMCKLLGIKKTRTTPSRPQSDGMVERFNLTVDQFLSKVVSSNQEDWDCYLPYFLLAYRSSIHESTRQTPARVMFGHELRLPCDLEFGAVPDKPLPVEEYVENLAEKLHHIHNSVQDHLRIASDRMKARYDVRANDAAFNEGDAVWFYNPRRRKGKSPKLQASWEGPYFVQSRLNDVVYRIRQGGKKPRIVHRDRLAVWHGPLD